MAARIILTQAEISGLIKAAESLFDEGELTVALIEAIGAERATKLLSTRKAIPWTKQDTEAVALALYPLVPGATATAKRKAATKAIKPAFATLARYEAVMGYVLEKVEAWLNEEESQPEPSAYQTSGTVCGYGPVNSHWKLPDGVVDQILNRMQTKNVRAYKVESVGHASEDVLGTPSKMEQMKRATLYAVDGCAKRGIYYHATLFNDNAGKSNWRNDGPALAKRLPQAKAFIDWFAKTVKPNGVYVVIVGETRTNAGKELEKYGAKKLKAAGFKIGNNQGSRPQSTTSFGGISTDFHEYHPTSIGDWPRSKAAHITSDTGAILAQLNEGGNVYGRGNPQAIAAWRAAAVSAGYAFANYYAFDVAEYDEAAIDAMSPGVVVEEEQSATDFKDDVDLSKAVWHGPDGRGCKVTERLMNLAFDGSSFRYNQSPGTAKWSPREGAKKCNQYACFFVKRNGVWTGGKFDWSSETRNSRDRINIDDGYTGGIVPHKGEEVRFCLTDLNMKKRTNAPGVIWK